MKLIEWVGVIMALSGSFMVSSGVFVGFIFFTVSSICLIYTAIRQNNKALMMMQLVFLMFNLNGIYNFLIKS